MKTITVQELKLLKDQNVDFQLIDVREVHEYEEANIGGHLIPLGEIPTRYNEISKEKQVIMQCRSGARSANAAMFLEQNYGYTNLYNLEGGILAWLNVFGE
ncbi:MAG: rhodanese-like domain-containing protein [Bacteroidota bacterium]